MSHTEIDAPKLLSYFRNPFFLLINDPQKEKKPIPLQSYNPEEFKKWNANKYGIFFTANGFKERRIEENLTYLNSAYIDFDIAKDNIPQPETEIKEGKKKAYVKLAKLKYPPNFITQTKNGLHALWLLEEIDLNPENITRYKEILKGIREWSLNAGSKGDRVYDVPRVLRLPGYYHHKKEPFLIHTYQLHENRYSLAQLWEIFPFFDYQLILNDNAKMHRELTDLDRIDIKEVVLAALKEYGEPEAYFDNSNRIVIARGVTGAFQGKHDDCQYIGSTSHEIPSGNKITFTRQLLGLLDNKAAYRWIADKFNLSSCKVEPFIPALKLKERNFSENNSDLRLFSGFKSLDEKLNGGFRGGNSYLVSGLEKCGKSSFLMTILNHLLSQNIKAGYINTELPDKDFLNRLAANWKMIPFIEIEKDSTHREEWTNLFGDNLLYAGPNDITQNYIISFEKSMQQIEDFVKKGAKVLIFDNLTTYGTQATQSKKGWEVLASCVSKILSFTKQHGVISFYVVHTKSEKVFTETPQGILGILKSDHPERIFEESITVIGKPNLSDVYGGGQVNSQIDGGALLVWAPFQKFRDSKYRGMTSIILDSFRTAPSGNEVRMQFRGEFFRFFEEENQGDELEEKVKIFTKGGQYE